MSKPQHGGRGTEWDRCRTEKKKKEEEVTGEVKRKKKKRELVSPDVFVVLRETVWSAAPQKLALALAPL